VILSKRERYIAMFVLVAIAVLVLDRYVLTPYLARRAQLTAAKLSILAELERAQTMFARKTQLSPKWEEMLNSGLKTDAAAAESAVLNALRDWSQESGLALSTLKPERSIQRAELSELTFQAAGVGTMSAVSRFLWRVESSPLPVRVNDLQLGARREGTDDLTLQVRVSALCVAPPPAKPAAARTAASGEGEDKQ
jgi:Tfp pilus assembly protein PilO